MDLFTYQWRIQDFPLGGGAPTHWGGANLRRVHFSVKTYVKTKEIDPVGGGGAPWHPLDLPMLTFTPTSLRYSGIITPGSRM